MPWTGCVDGEESAVGREKPVPREVDLEPAKRVIACHFDVAVMDVWSGPQDFFGVQKCRPPTYMGVKTSYPSADALRANRPEAIKASLHHFPYRLCLGKYDW